jgi:Cu/Zn superoxide dismutase
MSKTLIALLLAVSLALVGEARAGVEFRATLDAAQETPTPSGTTSASGGTAVMVLDTATNSVQYTVTFHDLTSTAIAAHIHTGARCVAGNIAQTLNPIASGTTPKLQDSLIASMESGGTYVNVHTTTNTNGEIRGQLALAPAKCPCDASFRRCVKAEIRKLARKDRKAAGVKALKRAASKASCGQSKGPKKAIACCLPLTPESNIATDHLCAAVPDKACKRLGGTNAGASCFPTNPCTPAAGPATCVRTPTTTTTLPPSPSGAFVE